MLELAGTTRVSSVFMTAEQLCDGAWKSSFLLYTSAFDIIAAI